jgi:hypothetical protein
MNTNGKRMLAGLSVLLASLILLYFLFRPLAASMDHAPVAHPVDKETVDGVPVPRRTKPTGNVDAITHSSIGHSDARTLFSKYYYCSRNLGIIISAKSRVDCSWYNGKPQFERAYATCLERSVDEQDAIGAARKAMAGCPNDEDTLMREYFNATKAAARMGDLDAQLCYLASDLVDSHKKSLYTKEDVADYQAIAPVYVADALKRGDWRIVALLSKRFIDRPSGFMLYLGVGQAETIYKMDKLLRLGATGSYASFLDDELSVYASPDGSARGVDLTQDKLASADEWAERTYTQYFASGESLTEPPKVCQSPE